MKPHPAADFPVTAWPLAADHAGPRATFYRGIWRLALNYTVEIFFVPPFPRDAGTWPPRLPESIDEPEDETAARLTTMALASYSVTASEPLAGGEEQVPSCDPLFDEPNVVFYVGAEEFAVLDGELAALFERLASPRRGPPVSELAGQRLAGFLLSRFLCSPHVDQRSLQILGR